jgi:hypothetical protein
MFIWLELHVAVVVRFCVLLSEYVPVAVNCSVLVVPIVGFAGVTAIETSVAGVTVRVAEPFTAPKTALILLDPVPRAVTIPPVVTVATLVVCELQVTEPVIFCIEPSE